MLNKVTPLSIGNIRSWVSPFSFNRLLSGNAKKAKATPAPTVKKLDKEELEKNVITGKIPIHKIEKFSKTPQDAVEARRKFYEKAFEKSTNIRADNKKVLNGIPYKDYEYDKVLGVCCENVVGYIPVPVGVAGPLIVDNEKHYVPLATTEGALVASVNRGCKAITLSGGTRTVVRWNGMTRAPVVEFPSAPEAAKLVEWLKSPKGFEAAQKVFNGSSKYIRLISITPISAGRMVYIRFAATTGDAMGMNMISQACEHTIGMLKRTFPRMCVLGVSGNVCSDKKPALINSILGRGRYVSAEVTVPPDVLRKVLNVDPDKLERLSMKKCWLGSALAGAAPGGLNAHAANVVAAMFLATGQDCAQVVESSNCVTSIEEDAKSGGIIASCSMPSVEVGTVGGGTRLTAQGGCLKMLGAQGPSDAWGRKLGENANRLAKVICSTVLAAELSLLSSLSDGTLVKSHVKLNRVKKSLPHTQ